MLEIYLVFSFQFSVFSTIMKKNVLDYEDVQEMAPILKSRLGLYLLKKFFYVMDMDKVNKIHSTHFDSHGSAFTTAILNDPLMDVRYEVHNREILNDLPKGAFITVSNHPIGSLDGIILIDIFASIRHDFRVMVNEILAHITALGDNFIPVEPKKDKTQNGNPKNINGIRLAFSHIKDGHPIGFFPSGSMSFYNKKLKRVVDRPWTHSIIRLIRKVNVPVIPVYFDCINSKLFYRLGQISWKIRQFWVAIEAFNKKGQTLHVHIGQPILPETIQTMSEDTELGQFLYDSTFNLCF